MHRQNELKILHFRKDGDELVSFEAKIAIFLEAFSGGQHPTRLHLNTRQTQKPGFIYTNIHVHKRGCKRAQSLTPDPTKLQFAKLVNLRR